MNDDVFSLSGKTALVTGGGSGLGWAISKALVQAGAKVIIIGRRKDVLEKACAQLGSMAVYKIFDLAQLEKIPALVNEIENEIGAINILVNNAGIHLKKELLEVSDTEFENIIKINQQAVFSLSREISKKMVPRKQGCIIMISSMAAIYGIPKVIAYTAAKAAIEGMTRAMAVELSPAGIRINCVAPGFIATDMSASALDNDKERKSRVLSRTPMGKLGLPEDVAYAVVYLSSEAAKYITGVVLPVDGGNSVGF